MLTRMGALLGSLDPYDSDMGALPPGLKFERLADTKKKTRNEPQIRA